VIVDGGVLDVQAAVRARVILSRIALMVLR